MIPITIKKKPKITLKYGKHYKKYTQKIIGGTSAYDPSLITKYTKKLKNISTKEQITPDKLELLNNVFDQYSKIFNSDKIPLFSDDTYYVQFMPYDGRNDNNKINYLYPYKLYYVDKQIIWHFNGVENVQINYDDIPNKTHIYKLDDISKISFFKSLFYFLNKISSTEQLIFSVTDEETAKQDTSIISTEQCKIIKNIKGIDLNKEYSIKKYNKLWVTINISQMGDQKFPYNYITYKPLDKDDMNNKRIFQLGYEVQLITKDKSKMFSSTDLKKVYKIGKFNDDICSLYFYDKIKNENDFTDITVKQIKINITDLINKYKLFIPYFFVNDMVSVNNIPNKIFKVASVLHYGYIKIVPQISTPNEINGLIYNCNELTKIEDSTPLSNNNIVCNNLNENASNKNYVVYVNQSGENISPAKNNAVLELNKNITIDTVKTWINKNCDSEEKIEKELEPALIDEYNNAIEKLDVPIVQNNNAIFGRDRGRGESINRPTLSPQDNSELRRRLQVRGSTPQRSTAQRSTAQRYTDQTSTPI